MFVYTITLIIFFMRSLLFCFLLISTCRAFAQHDLYKLVKLGDHKVGYCDSLIFSSDESYTQFGYNGPAPLFLQIWHPIDDSISGNQLSYNEFRDRTLDDALVPVYNSLVQKMDSSFVWYNVADDFVDFEPIDYGAFSAYDVLDTIKTIKTQSLAYDLINKSELPVIVYHHGAQGLSDENFLLAEYFASRGYIVVSSNFHLPLKDKTYGNSNGRKSEAVNLTKCVIDFAKSLTSTKEIFYIGHSWGAQVGFSFLYEPEWVNAFVSMETTLEFWSEEEVAKKWSSLQKILAQHKREYMMPCLYLANTMKDQPFDVFKDVSGGTSIHASAKKEFGHESYTTVYLLRYFFADQFPQPDISEMKEQYELYVKHLGFVENFLLSCKKKSKLDFSKYDKDFFIHQFDIQVD